MYDGATGHMSQRHWGIYYNLVRDFRDREKVCSCPLDFLLEARLFGLV